MSEKEKNIEEFKFEDTNELDVSEHDSIINLLSNRTFNYRIPRKPTSVPNAEAIEEKNLDKIKEFACDDLSEEFKEKLMDFFKLNDKDNDGLLSYHEFLSFFLLFKKNYQTRTNC
ncbi:unnamed protein product [Brachionus calyciflorus]|uniref:EF-hand domain-containing protein n=1 Tax=Brachionus calyciflorus TaxID=104777 RepID=A0A813WKH3_9BILA|nr:unnamed protein product [Brachionus calyciflorus]